MPLPDLLQTMIDHYDLSDLIENMVIIVLLCLLVGRLRLRLTFRKGVYDY